MDGLPELPKTKADPYANASTTDPAATGTIWVERATRALATFAVVETMKGGVKDINQAMAGENRYQAILRGDAVASRAEIDALNKHFSGVLKDPNPDFAKYLNTLKADIGDARFRTSSPGGRSRPRPKGGRWRAPIG